MTKFFRNSGRTLVLIVMSLLLVIFLVGDILTRGVSQGSYQDPAVATAFGKPVTFGMLQSAETDLRMAASMRLPLAVSALPGEGRDVGLAAHLLMTETDALGAVFRPQWTQEWLDQYGATSDQINGWLTQRRISLAEFYDRIGRMIAVQVNLSAQLDAARLETPAALVREYRDQRQSADVRLVLIDARAFLSDVPEPDDDALRAFFETAKDRTTGHTQDELRFGYQLPDRVRVEWLTVDPDAIRDSVQVKLSEARAYYASHPDEFSRPFVGPQEAPDAPSTVLADFDAVKSQARDGARREKAVLEAQRLINELRADLVASGAADLAAAAKRSNLPFAVQHGTTELVDQTGLFRVEGLGRARMSVDDQTYSLPQFAMRVAGLVAPEDKPLLGVGELGPVAIVTRGADPRTRAPLPYQSYLFRVVEAAPKGPPTFDEVRERLARDWKLTEAFTLAQARAERLMERARVIGLEAAMEEAADLHERMASAAAAASQPVTGELPLRFVDDIAPFTPTNFTRLQGNSVRGIFLPGLAEALFALADSPDSHRAILRSQATHYKWVVAELLGVDTLYEGDFKQFRLEQLEAQNQSAQSSPRIAQVVQSWLDPEQILRRANFAYLEGFEPTSDESP